MLADLGQGAVCEPTCPAIAAVSFRELPRVLVQPGQFFPQPNDRPLELSLAAAQPTLAKFLSQVPQELGQSRLGGGPLPGRRPSRCAL